MKYITSSVVTITAANGLLIQLNKALTTETITLAAGGTTFGIITGPAAAGAQFRCNGLRGQGVITITPSAAVDAMASLLNRDV